MKPTSREIALRENSSLLTLVNIDEVREIAVKVRTGTNEFKIFPIGAKL
jgi:hypothetical protein